MNGFRSYTNTPTDARESPLGTGLLHLSRLRAVKDALTISAPQRIVLDEEKDKLQRLLLARKLELEEEYLQGRKGSPDPLEGDPALQEMQKRLNDLHAEYQERLDYLNKRFQRDWTSDPRNKGEWV